MFNLLIHYFFVYLQLKENKCRVLNISEGDSKYLASEVLEGVYTTSCDVFSLGVTLLELATDLVLPPNGTLWHELRNGVFPPIFFERVGCDMAKIIQHMMLNKHQMRPSVEILLNLSSVDRILEERKTKPRTNYLANHSAMQDPDFNRNEAIPDHNANNAIDCDNIEDDGVSPLSLSLDNFEQSKFPYKFCKPIRDCTNKLFEGEINANDDDVRASTSNAHNTPSSPASSDSSTPPSSHNKRAVFSPIRSNE